MFKIDLHTHSTASPDGGITAEQYGELLESNTLDYIAITDHDTIDLALHLHQIHGDKIIVGEEITTSQGELIGLFLTHRVKPGQSLEETAEQVHAQGGLLYVPHPFETVRKGVQKEDLTHIETSVDIVEAYNGRAVAQNKGPEALVWARLHNKATAASSDAHGARGVGTAYTSIKEEPTTGNLIEQLRAGIATTNRPPLHTLLYPKANRIKNALRRKK